MHKTGLADLQPGNGHSRSMHAKQTATRPVHGTVLSEVDLFSQASLQANILQKHYLHHAVHSNKSRPAWPGYTPQPEVAG
jgi:hypothetical protein